MFYVKSKEMPSIAYFTRLRLACDFKDLLESMGYHPTLLKVEVELDV